MTIDPTSPTTAVVPPRRIDVSGLPDHAWDERSPVWWGNALLMFIESTTVAILLATYFYLRQNFNLWPPPKSDVIPPIGQPFPKLLAGSLDAAIVVASCAMMYWTDMAARRKDRGKVLIGLGVMLLVALAAIALRFWEFRQVLVRWNDNAYASTVWTMLGTHLTYLLAGAAEFFIMALWMLRHDLDEKHALDVTLAGGYWYWTAATWAILYVVIFWSPHFL